MTVWLDKQRNKWRYRFIIANKPYSGYCIHPDTNKPAKTEREARIIDTLIRERTKARPNNPPAAGYSLLEAVAYYSEQHAKYLGEWESIKGRTEELLKWFGANTDISAITDEDVEKYTNWSRKQKIKRYCGGSRKKGQKIYREMDRLRGAATVNDYLATLSQVLSVAPARRHLPVLPIIKLLKVPKRIPTPITHDTIEKILKNSAPHLQKTIILCIHTGMREREALTVRAGQFNSEQGVIYLDEKITKARKGRAVYINDVAREVIRQCMEDGDKLWAILQNDPKLAKKYATKWGIKERNDIPLILFQPRGPRGTLHPIQRISVAWKTARRKAGAEGKIRFHDTRATFCSNLASAGVDPISIQRLAGHEDITTTMRYVKASDENLRGAVDLLGSKRPQQLDSNTSHRNLSHDDEKKETTTK